MTPGGQVEAEARRVLDDATAHQEWTAEWVTQHRTLARSVAKLHAQHGSTSPYDDPVLSVRCSVLVALCEAVLGIERAPVGPHPDQLEMFAEVHQ